MKKSRFSETQIIGILKQVEAGRQERVIRIFPNDESALRLIGALLAEQNETWLERKYLDMQEYHDWAATHITDRKRGTVAALSA